LLNNQVNSMAWRERHPVAAESDMPVLIAAFFNLGLHNPSRDHNREGQALSISSQRRDSFFAPVRHKAGHA
jgi:hypothetical protein